MNGTNLIGLCMGKLWMGVAFSGLVASISLTAGLFQAWTSTLTGESKH